MDFIWRDEASGEAADEASSGGDKTVVVPALALIGLGAALVATILLWGTPPTVVLAMMAVDPFALFFKIIAIACVMLVILAAVPYLQGRTRLPGRVLCAARLCLPGHLPGLVGHRSDLHLPGHGVPEHHVLRAGRLPARRQEIQRGGHQVLSLRRGDLGGHALWHVAALWRDGHHQPGRDRPASWRPATQSLQWLAVAAIVLLLAGFGFKIVLAPFHQWAPDTYEGAPTPVTAFLSVGSKAAGFAILMRVFLTALPAFRWEIGWMAFLMALSIISMVLGNLIALRQTNIKRMLAYSSIGQAGFIIIGFICLTLDVGERLPGHQRYAVLPLCLPLHQPGRLYGGHCL